MRGIIVKALISLSIFLVSPVQAETGLTRLVTGNDSKGWDAVGRLEIAGKAFCTGTLISPDRVLTAAHCLFDDKTMKRVRDGDVTFLAGWRGSRATATVRVRKSFIHPNYAYDGSSNTTDVWNDVAVLILDAPVRKSSISPIPVGDRPAKGDAVIVVSYAHDRSEYASLEDGCHVLARPLGALILSCSVDFGSSGAPIMVREDGVARIVSVVSAKGEVRGRPVSLGTGIDKPLAAISEVIAADKTTLTSAGPKVRRLELGASGGDGPKFMRP